MAFATSTNPSVASIGGGRDMALADLGAYFVAVTPTPGTGIITGGSVQAFTETTPYLVVFNGGPLNIYPAYLRLRQSVVGATASVATFLTTTIDQGNRLSAIGSGVVLAKSNTNSGSPIVGGAVCTAGPITASAATGARRITSHSAVRSLTIGVVHDTIAMNWGASTQSLVSTLINNTTSHSDTVINNAPIVIGPNQSMVIVHWAASQTTGSTYEIEFAYVEK
jgi:hypothetical protein